MKWEDYKHEFDFDGSWRDIYVLNTSVDNWQRLIDFLHSSVYQINFFAGGDEVALSQQAAEILDLCPDSSGYLEILLGEVTLNCRFFCEQQIEFDFDPREIHSEIQAKQVFDFMCQLSQSLSKEVILTAENAEDLVIFRATTDNRIEYIPPTPR